MLYTILNKLRCVLLKCRYGSVLKFQNIVAKHFHIQNRGRNNCICIQNNSEITNCRFFLVGDNNIITVGSGVRMNGITCWIEDNNNHIHIGHHCSFEDGTQLAACEGTKISIGDDCMFSNKISVRTTDSHSILDQSGKRTNPATDIFIGNHVWIGYEALILKGSVIDDDCIVASRAVVSSSTAHASHSIIAGLPATIIKQGTTWCRKRL